VALETADGFDTYVMSQLLRRHPTTALSGGGTSIFSPGVDGVGGYYGARWLAAMVTFAVTPRLTYIVCFDLRIDLANATTVLLLRNSSNGTICSLSVNADGSLSTSFGGSAPAGTIRANTWQSVRVKLVVDSSIGSWQVIVDGATVVNLTGINTGTDAIASMNFGNSGGSWIVSVDIDNVVVFNTLGAHSNDIPLGKLSVVPLRPVADGTHRDFVPYGGGPAHFSLVNEAVADDDTTYVKSSTPGAKETYTMTPLSTLAGTAQIHGVVHGAVLRKDDLNPKVLHLLAKSGATESEGSDYSPPLVYGWAGMVLTDDPGTGSQWTIAGLNAAEFGEKVVI
jgi:hypothetical protein